MKDLEVEIEDGSEEEGEKDTYTADYWKRWLRAAKKAAEDHWSLTHDAWKEYEHGSSASSANDRDNEKGPACYPIYWSSVDTLEPSFYSRTPKITSRRKFGVEDSAALLQTKIVERLGEYLIENCDFDEVMQLAVLDFIHGNKATTQLVYDADLVDSIERRELVEAQLEDGSTGIIDPSTNEIFAGEVLQDDSGYYYEEAAKVPTNQKIALSPAIYDEVLHTPDAKINSEIKEMAYHFCLSKEEAEARFGEDKVAKVNWKTNKKFSDESKQDSDDKLDDVPGQYMEGWEIWCKPSRSVYIYSDQCVEGLLDKKEDPYHLKDFFPSPKIIIGSRKCKSMFPTPAYIQVRPVVRQLHSCLSKVFELIRCIRRRALVDGSQDELVTMLEGLGDNEFIVVQQLQQIVEKGGLSNLVHYLPVAELVAAITELTQLEDVFKNLFYEWFGMPDILRGASDPLESASAQELKAGSANDRFKFKKKLVAKLARDSIRMMVDLALGVFSTDKIAAIAGVAYMSEEEKAAFDAELQALRDDDTCLVRIDIETDTMSFADEALRAQQTNTAVQTVTQGLQQVAQMSASSPEMAQVGLQAILLSLDGLAPGRQFEIGVKKAVQALIDKAGAPPPQQPPDYEGMKLQLAGQKQQLEAQARARELDMQQTKLMLGERDAEFKRQLEAMNFQLSQRVQQFVEFVEAERLKLDQFATTLNEREKMIEEARLAGEQQLEGLRIQLGEPQQQAPQIIAVQPQPMQAAPINIINTPQPAAQPEPVLVDMSGGLPIL